MPVSRRAGTPRRTWVWWVIACTVAAWLLWMTLRPNQIVASNLAPLTTSANRLGISTHLLINLAGNVAVFVPLGAAVALALNRHSLPARLLLGTLAGSALSAAIELAQLAAPSRASSAGDWALNTLGAASGALLGCIAEKTYHVLRGRHTCHAIQDISGGTHT